MAILSLLGDCREVLRTLADDSVHCCVTSPPYYGLRDYGAAGQIGLEATPDEYVAELVAVFREVRRALREDGTCWLNLGDSYATRPNGSIGATTLEGSTTAAAEYRRANALKSRGLSSGIKHKDLLGIPWMVAFALRADGWWLRKSIIWAKGNAMPESVFDRPTSSHENVFLLTKAENYSYDWFAIAEPTVSDHASGNGFRRSAGRSRDVRGSGDEWRGAGGVRNARDVWTINVQPFGGAHFATMPPMLAEQCIRAGTPEFGCCRHCGAPWERIVVRGEPDLARQRACGADVLGGYAGQSTKGHAAAGVQDASDVKRRILEGMVEKTTGGWQMTCRCPIARPGPCTVLDPFGGAGTTALVADRIGRHATTIELNPDYGAMARQRVEKEAGMFASVSHEQSGQVLA